MVIEMSRDCIAIEMGHVATLRGMSTKSLRPEQNERLREIVRDVIAKDFSGNATAAARAFGVAQGLVSEFLSGGRGAGPKLIQGLADYTGRSIDDLYGRPALPLAAGGHQLIGSRADWPAVRDVVIAKSRRLTPLDVERVAGVSMSQPPEKLSEEFVTRLAVRRREDANEADAWWVTVHLTIPEARLGETNPHVSAWFQGVCEEAHDSITFAMLSA